MKNEAYTYIGIEVERRSECMEYAKDEVFQIGYCTKLNRLERKDESWMSIFCQSMKRHKLLAATVVTFLVLASMNTVMLVSFMRILQNI